MTRQISTTAGILLPSIAPVVCVSSKNSPEAASLSPVMPANRHENTNIMITHANTTA